MHVYLRDQQHEASLGQMTTLPDLGDYVAAPAPDGTRALVLVTARTFERRAVTAIIRTATPEGTVVGRGPVEQWVCVLNGEPAEAGG